MYRGFQKFMPYKTLIFFGEVDRRHVADRRVVPGLLPAVAVHSISRSKSEARDHLHASFASNSLVLVTDRGLSSCDAGTFRAAGIIGQAKSVLNSYYLQVIKTCIIYLFIYLLATIGKLYYHCDRVHLLPSSACIQLDCIRASPTGTGNGHCNGMMVCCQGRRGPTGTGIGAAILGARKGRFLAQQISEESCALEEAWYVLGQCNHGDDRASQGMKGKKNFTRQRAPTLQECLAHFAGPSCRQWLTGHSILGKNHKALPGESARRVCREA